MGAGVARPAAVGIVDGTVFGAIAGDDGPTGALCLDLARAVVRCGVDLIECGRPGVPADLSWVALIAGADLGVPVLAGVRPRAGDIDAVRGAGAQWVGMVADTGVRPSDVAAAVAHARALGLRVRVGVDVDSEGRIAAGRAGTGGDPWAVLAAAVEAGADRVGLVDPAGVLEPRPAAGLVTLVRQRLPGTDIEVRFLDDRGLATANALAAVDAGARWVCAAANGLGPRAGVVDLATLVANLAHRGQRAWPDRDALRDASERVGVYRRSVPDERRPVVGRNAFRHAARLHRLAVGREPLTYEWVAPEQFGADRVIGGRVLPQGTRQWAVPPVARGGELVLMDDALVPDARQYCAVHRVPGPGPERDEDVRAYPADCLLVFLGDDEGYRGLRAELTLGEEVHIVFSPATVFVPAGVPHRYRVLDGRGSCLRHLRAGTGDGRFEPLKPRDRDGRADLSGPADDPCVA